MLTQLADRQRTWKDYPAIGALVSAKKLSTDWTGPTSVSSNIFESMERLLTVYALVRDNEDEVKRHVQAETLARKDAEMRHDVDEIKRLHELVDSGESIIANMHELSEQLKDASKYFVEASESIRNIARK